MQCSFMRAACALVLAGGAASAETVVTSVKLGSNVESATYAPNGRFTDTVLALDGNDVVAIPLARAAKKTGKGDAAHPDNGNHYALGHLRNLKGDTYFKAFDVNRLSPEFHAPRGIVYSPVNQRFYFSSKFGSVGGQLQSTDDQGNPMPALNADIGDVSNWLDFEGLAWIPADAPKHANTIAALGQHLDGLSHVYYLRLDGTIEAEVVPTANSTLTQYLCGITYQKPGRLLVTACQHDVYAMDLDGNAQNATVYDDPDNGPYTDVAPVATSTDPDGVESLLFDNAGNFWLASYETATLRAFDASLNRTPERDIPFSVGLGVSVGRVAYDSEHDEILTLTRARGTLVAIAADLRSARTLPDILTHPEMLGHTGLHYLGGNRIAVGSVAFTAPDGTFLPRGLTVFDLSTDTVVSRAIFNASDDFPAGAPFAPLGVAPWNGGFLLNVRGDSSALKSITSTGTPRAEFPTAYRPTRLPDLALSGDKGGANLQVFGTGGATRIFTGTRLFDASGTLVHEIDTAPLALIDGLGGVDAVWIGGNRYAALDGDTSRLVIFTVP